MERKGGGDGVFLTQAGLEEEKSVAERHGRGLFIGGRDGSSGEIFSRQAWWFLGRYSISELVPELSWRCA